MVQKSLFVAWALVAPLAMGQTPASQFTFKDAIQAEWRRQMPPLTPEALAALPAADRARWDLSLRRIGAPGAPALLPVELDKPTEELWLRKAGEARTPQERVTALTFLNRLKSPSALRALDGLTAADARTWPASLHLEAAVAAARLRGSTPSPEAQTFLEQLEHRGKVDPVRAQAARLRLVAAGKERTLLPLQDATPFALMALMDAWNTLPWDVRLAWTDAQLAAPCNSSLDYGPLGLAAVLPDPEDEEGEEDMTEAPSTLGFDQRLIQGLPQDFPDNYLQTLLGRALGCSYPLLERIAAIEALGRSRSSAAKYGALTLAEVLTEPLAMPSLLTALRKLDAAGADRLGTRMLESRDPLLRAAALEDAPLPPLNLDTLAQSMMADRELDPLQSLITALDRWNLPAPHRIRLLTPFLGHRDWGWRHTAWQALVKLDPQTPWPSAPEPSEEDRAQLKLAGELAEAGQPVRVRLTFETGKSLVMRLDPTVAPLNVANLVRLTEKGFFNGRKVPRIVPDFVVQMGSPYDTMDGGPGYTVRCENSLMWYGPGSVGMALSGKDTGGSQFFITLNATPHLTGRYTRVGEVEDLDQALAVLEELDLGMRLERAEIIKESPAKGKGRK